MFNIPNVKQWSQQITVYQIYTEITVISETATRGVYFKKGAIENST